MDWRQFASSMAGHVVWPIVVIIALLVLRKPIVDRINKLTRVTGPGFAAEFVSVESVVDQALQAEAERPVRTIESVGEPSEDPAVAALEQKFEAIATTAIANPSYAIVASWSTLESIIRDASGTILTEGRTTGRIPTIISELIRHEMLTAETNEALAGLRRLRNEVAHGALQPDGGSAIAYVGKARDLARSIWYSVVHRMSGDNP